MKKIKHKVSIEIPPVTEDEATELMIHHLQLAAAYYEATPDDYDTNYKEMERIMDSGIPGFTTPALKAARAWFYAIDVDYKGMKTDD